MTIKIKEATSEDFETLILFRLKLLKHDHALDYSTEYTINKINKSAKYMKKYLRTKDNKYLIVYQNSIPIGYLHVTYDDKKDKTSSYLSELFVLEPYRQQGIGKN